MRVFLFGAPWARVVVVAVATALSLVVVSNPASAVTYSGTIVAAYAENPEPRLSANSPVHFEVSEALRGAWLVVYDEDGRGVRECSSGTVCTIWSNPAPGETKTYTGHLRVQSAEGRVDVQTASVVVTDPGFESGFTGAYADNPTPVLAASTYVTFMLEAPLNEVPSEVVIYDEDGRALVRCGSRSQHKDRCGTYSNPAPGETKTYTAHLRVQGESAWFEAATATVSVTDPGYSVGFTAAYADNPMPVLSESTYVNFVLEAPMNEVPSEVHITNEAGAVIATCGGKSLRKDWCGTRSNPAPGETRNYTAHLRAQGENGWFEVATSTVSVTDPGWSGSISVAAPTSSFHEAGEVVSGLFQVTRPLESARVEVYFDGVYHHACGSGDTCGFNVTLGDSDTRVIRADVYADGVSVWPVASAQTFLTSLSTDDFAEWAIAAPASVLELKLGADAAASISRWKALNGTPSFCLSLGQRFPTYRFEMTIPDLTAACLGGAALGLGYMLGELGLEATLLAIDMISDDAPADPIDPPLPQPDPTDPDNPAGGGLLPDPKPGVVYVDMDAESWIRSDVICTVTTTDPQSLEEITIALDGEGLKHIIQNHLATEDPAKSRWDEIFREGITDGDLADFEDKLVPENFKLLSAFLCNEVLTREPNSWGISNDDDERLVRNFSVPGSPIGNLGVEPHAPTNEVGVVLDLDLRVYTAHPGASNQYH